MPILQAYANYWRFREGMIYLMPAPLYHSAPLSAPRERSVWEER